MRTEYRIVATLDTEHIRDGKKYHHDPATCWWDGHPINLQTFDKAQAEQYLEWAKEECRKFDKETQKRTDRNSIRYWHSNIRIQTRQVSDWE